jgi:hypothetical protein
MVTAVVLVGTTTAAVGATQQTGPTVVDPNLEVRTHVAGLSQPLSMAFLASCD